MLVYSDTVELKKVLGIALTNTVEDAKLGFLIEQASSLITEFLGRNTPPERKERTEYYHGTGSIYLLLKHRPVELTPAVRVDDGGYFGAATDGFAADTALTYGTDYVLENIDADLGSARSGIMLRINSLWPKRQIRRGGLLTPYRIPGMGNIRVVYTAGWTVDTLPAAFRLATNMLVARPRIMFPYGFLSNSESYEERSVSLQLPDKDELMSIVKSFLWGFRNFKW